MNQFIIPIVIAIIGSIIIFRDSQSGSKKRRKRNVLAKREITFQEHVNEMKEIIARCNSRSEWSVLDWEIGLLESTWIGKIEDGKLQTEIGRLTTQWLNKRVFFDTSRKTIL